MRAAGLVAAIGLACVVTGASAQEGSPPVRPPVARGAIFVVDLLFPCLTHVEQGRAIADLPDLYKQDLTPATGADAKVPIGREQPSAVWISKSAGARIHVIEIGPDKCVIQAVGYPVQETLGKAAAATQTLDPPYVSVPVKTGYWPVVYQTEGERNGRHVVVRLEGAEPGGFGHASRFPLLSATVTARTAS